MLSPNNESFFDTFQLRHLVLAGLVSDFGRSLSNIYVSFQPQLVQVEVSNPDEQFIVYTE